MWFQFRPYVPVAQRRAQAAREVAKRVKKGQAVSPGRHRGPDHRAARSGARRGATTWNPTATTKTACRAAAPTSATARWWTCRSSRARSRRRSAARSFTRSTSPSRRCRTKEWRSIKSRCAGQIGSVVELLQGKLSKSVIEHRHGARRRPVPQAERDQDVVFLPGLGRHVQARRRRPVRRRSDDLDHQPELLFRLRKVDHLELIEEAVSQAPARDRHQEEDARRDRGGRRVRDRTGGARRRGGAPPRRSRARSPRRPRQARRSRRR